MGLDDDIAILAAAPVFELFGRDALRLLSFAGERRLLGKGELLFARGEPSDGGYVVMSGTIALVPARSGAKPVTVSRSGVIGRNALFRQVERPAEARAVEPAEVMRVTPSVMSRVLREFPDAAAAIHDGMAEELLDLVQGLSGVRERLVGLAPRKR
ncbi:cyclic nucleotide-binding protein [Methylobacterium sp. Leaf123]|uniref:Crp/Fnr family transcriptional regulator n=1 Tax=Methylobacterium sp. Leaf123 TaxID=1736264 RepID=UPI0006F83F52|nr:Crp/Fnr family transcriptional regulator [Methylobacterium sp. Leaf123]KQQ12105.1 cyclic nucleotide-binding protein [Methylobacterium sp. Leaf123]